MKLFIDDIRMPSDVGLVNEEWTIVRDFYEAMQVIRKHKPQTIAFDHDLGDEGNPQFGMKAKTGLTIAQQIVSRDMYEPSKGWVTENFTFTCHSANPVGKENILGLLNGYMKEKYGK